jgi:hypothetical protein
MPLSLKRTFAPLREVFLRQLHIQQSHGGDEIAKPPA